MLYPLDNVVYRRVVRLKLGLQVFCSLLVPEIYLKQVLHTFFHFRLSSQFR